MDVLSADIGKLYRKYLLAALGSALVTSFYSFVDTIAVGQSEGAAGTAAMAVITPLYGLISFLGILCGIGGSVLMGHAKGSGNQEKGNAYFTASVFLMIVVLIAAWTLFAVFHEAIFTFFGADESIMPQVWAYGKWVLFFFPVFVLSIFLSAFIRNDGAPSLAMTAVIIGGCLNIFGDWYLVFPLGMGMTGAALASAIGTTLQLLILLSRFFSPNSSLRLVRTRALMSKCGEILKIGISAGLIDFGTVALAVMMNNQIMRYGGSSALAVYGVLATITTLLMALFSGSRSGDSAAGVGQFRSRQDQESAGVSATVPADGRTRRRGLHALRRMLSGSDSESVYRGHRRECRPCAGDDAPVFSDFSVHGHQCGFDLLSSVHAARKRFADRFAASKPDRQRRHPVRPPAFHRTDRRHGGAAALGIRGGADRPAVRFSEKTGGRGRLTREKRFCSDAKSAKSAVRSADDGWKFVEKSNLGKSDRFREV